jgi:cytochrome c biogenesis protein
MRIAEWLAAPHWMVVFFVLTAAGSLLVAHDMADATTVMPLPFTVFTLNLVAAIIARPALRTNVPLLLFHVALLVLVLLFGIARLTYFDGATAITAGVAFENDLARDDRGPLHRDRLDEVRFANAGFTENFPQRGRYLATYNRVRWWDEHGNSHLAEIGDDRPLLIAGYRIYTSRNRGFSPTLLWQPAGGERALGTVQLVDTQMGDFAPVNKWRIPAGPEVWAMVDMREGDKPAPGARRANLGAGQVDHALVLRIDDQRHELRPGESLTLPDGVLTYVRLDSWMSYRIIHDPTKPWLVATVLVAIASLVWFYVRRFRGRRTEQVE